MKLVIASDIHGSAYYCRKLLKRLEEEKEDRLILLAMYYLMVRETIFRKIMHRRKSLPC